MDKKEENLLEKVNKLSLPATILIGCVILGGFYYFSQMSKQNSIEKQQQAEMELKKETDRQDHITKRRAECLQIYKTESDKWNNTQSFRYIEPVEHPSLFESSDVCEITYKEPNKKSQAQCDKNLEAAKAISSDDTAPSWAIDAYFSCSDGTFTKEF